MAETLRRWALRGGRRWVAPALALTAVPLGAALAQSRPAGDAPPAASRAVEDAGELPGGDPPEITPAVKAAIESGLRYLVTTQNRDGSWRTRGASGAYPVAMTSLAGLALMAGGSTPTQGPHAQSVSSALTFVLKSARGDGLIAQVEEENHCMHGHGFAILFLSQCFGMEENPQRQAEIRLAIQRAVELTARSQSAAGGWLYTPDSGADEGSVTVTQLQGLRAARNVGIAVPKRVIDNAIRYLEKSTNDDGGIRYQVSDNGPSRPAITAAAVACYFNAGFYDDPRALRALKFCEGQLHPSSIQSARYSGHYFYAQLYMAQVMYLLGEDKWRDYFKEMRQVLVQKQERSDGSWDGDHIGPTYGTAVALIILQLPYKNLPIMQR